MKIYVFILILLVSFCGCRSNSSLSEVRKESVSEKTKEQLQSTVQTSEKTITNVDQTVVDNSTSNQQTTSNSAKDSESDEFKNKKTKETYYDKNGNIRAVIETEEQSGRTDKIKEQVGSSHSSSESRHDSADIKTSIENDTGSNITIDSQEESDTNIDLEGEINETAVTDSRPIQGVEWFYVLTVFAIAILLFIILNRVIK